MSLDGQLDLFVDLLEGVALDDGCEVLDEVVFEPETKQIEFKPDRGECHVSKHIN